MSSIKLSFLIFCIISAASSHGAFVDDRFLFSLRSPRPFHALDSPTRNKTCVASSQGQTSLDDAANILSAVRDCNRGGHVMFAKGLTYSIRSPLNFTGLSEIDLDIQGTLSFSDNITYWEKNSFDLEYQNATSFFTLGGNDVHVYGPGEIHGNGQAWWDSYPGNKKLKRPILFAVVGLNGGSVSQLKMRNSPFWHNIVMESNNVVYSDLDLVSTSNNGNFEKNTDGWDIYKSDNIVIENSTITNGDDCVSFKPNSTNILVQNLRCNGTHGVSVGSLGQYPDRVDRVENIFVRNITMENSSEGARIKVWPDAYSQKSESLTGGGGRGLVRNITYDGMWLNNVDYGLTITQCYGQDDEEECFKHPSKLSITDIMFRNIRGRTNRVFSPIVGHLVCSSPHTCSGILAENVDIRTVNGSNLVTCRNVDAKTLGGLNCTEWSKGYNPA